MIDCILTRTPYFIAACKAGWKYAHADDELALRWYWHHEMHSILVDVETAEKYLGGKTMWEFRYGYFPESLKEGRCINGRIHALPEDMQAISKAWYEDDLFGAILNKEPGVLADVRYDAVEWFGLLLDHAIYENRPKIRICNERSLRQLAWSGYTRDDFDWRED